MSTTSSETSPKAKRGANKPSSSAARPKSPRRAKPEPATVAAPAKKAPSPTDARVTKQERVLTLLSQPDGASIADMMQATEWQQHSVRGFLAGTVKKKLGFNLTSSKAEGDVRRYRIQSKRR